MKFGKGDVVHTVDKDSDGMQVIGIVVDVDYKNKAYAVQVNDSKTVNTYWLTEEEVY